MAGILSTGAINFITGQGSFREMLKDCVLSVWSGTAPTTADAAATGTLLCTYTKASGACTGVYADAFSVPETDKVVFTDHDDGETYDIHVTVDGVLTSVNFTMSTAGIGGHTLILAAQEFARQCNLIPGVMAISDGVDTVYVRPRVGGLAITVADGAGGTAVAPTITEPVTLSRAGINTLQFGPPTAGVISKTADVWSGVVLATGVAGYFRFHNPVDTASGQVLSTTACRYQGAIATSGLEGTLTNTTLTVSATSTIDTATITLPIQNS